MKLVLQHLARRSPQIKTLHLKIKARQHSEEFNFDDTRDTVAELINAFPLLDSIALPPELMSFQMIRNLSLKSNLVRLWTTDFAITETAVGEQKWEREIDNQSPKTFVGLRSFSLDSTTFMSLTKTSLCGSMNLMLLHVEISEENHGPTVLDLISTNYPNLRDIAVIYATWLPHLAPSSFRRSLTMDALEPLLSMRRLESIVVDHPLPPALTDQDLGRFARSFPELKHLELCVQAWGHDLEVVPTLSCLLPFAEHCRKLVSIGIYIDATVRPPTLTDVSKAFSPSLRVMQVFCSRIWQHHPVADFLAAILPPDAKLTMTRHSDRLIPVVGQMSDHIMVTSNEDLDDTSKKYRSKWQEASRLLEDLRSVRCLLAIGRKEKEEV